MRRALLLPLLTAPLISALLIPSTFHGPLSRFFPTSLTHPNNQQSPIMNPIGPVQPGDQPSTSQPDTSISNPDASDLTISDILPLSRSINIFAQLTRDIASITSRLSTTDSANTTLLAPLNSAMQALPRKPWEDRPGDTSEVKAADNEQKASDNLRRFVENHVVTESPWKEGDKTKTLGGEEVWWQVKDGKKVVMGKGWEVEVAEVLGKVGNGEVWAVKGVVNYE